MSNSGDTDPGEIGLLARITWLLIVFCTGMVAICAVLVVVYWASFVVLWMLLVPVTGVVFLTAELLYAKSIQRWLTPNKVLSGLLTILLTPPALGLSAISYFLLIENPWHSISFHIPDSTITLTYRWRGIHPFLAEYERKVQITTEAGPLPESWLWDNTGGHQHINIYLHNFDGEQWLRLKDNFGEYVFNFKTKEAEYVIRAYGRPYRGRLEHHGDRNVVMLNNDPETIGVAVGNNQGMFDPRFVDPGRYLGCLVDRAPPYPPRLRFISSKERPEQEIKTAKDLHKNEGGE